MSQAITKSYDLLCREIQKWIFDKGWEELKQIQEESIFHVLKGSSDIIITAATAGGKTEAAFLPVITQMMNKPSKGFAVVCISPLKALINDQYARLESISKFTGTRVYPWHGDIAASLKKNAFTKPENSILLITPESLEAMFINKASNLHGLFNDLQFIVIDELHSFLGQERGKQLQSLMSRISAFCRIPIRKIALSATLGDITIAKSYLSSSPDAVVHVQGKGSRELKVMVNSYPVSKTGSNISIMEQIFRVFRGSKNLIFANSRSAIECYTTGLSDLCKNNHLPVEFFAHHGNLSKEIRLDSERRLKDNSLPATILATSTLELGIDVGSVKRVGQIGSPNSVSSLVQRLGRSGRILGEASILRCYLEHPVLDEKSEIFYQLHPTLIQTIAVINLLLRKWYEPPAISALHLSTFIQQVLSFIAQNGGGRLDVIYENLCLKGAFNNIGKQLFIDLMICLQDKDLIKQDSEKFIMLARTGEILVNDYEFYAAFTTTEDYRVVYNDRTIGYIPVAYVIYCGMPIILAGKKWMVQFIDDKNKIISVERSKQKSPINFGGSPPEIDDEIVQEMKRVYEGESEFSFINEVSATILKEARYWHKYYKLEEIRLLAYEGNVIGFTWKGSQTNRTLRLMLEAEGLAAQQHDFGILVKDIQLEDFRTKLINIIRKKALTEEMLASFCDVKTIEKHDIYLTEELLCKNYASKYLNCDKGYSAINFLLERVPK